MSDVHVEIEYQGQLRCEAVHGPSGARFVTDAPVDNCGKGESFSPTDLVATALGACMVTIMGIAAEKHGWDLTGTKVSVRKGMVAAPRRRIGEIEVVIRVPRPLDERARKVLEKAALACPVRQSLPDAMERPIRFEWAGVPAGS